MQINKLKRFNLIKRKLQKYGDKLGKGIDKDILETVAILNALGIHTSGSCGGHLKWGVGAPWIDIEAKNTKKLEGEVQESYDIAVKAQELGKGDKKVKQLFNHHHFLRIKLKTINISMSRKLWPYLTDYYNKRNPDFDSRLTLTFYSRGIGRLQSQGAEFQETRPSKEREMKLVKYQNEMKKFTKHLMNKYISEK